MASASSSSSSSSSSPASGAAAAVAATTTLASADHAKAPKDKHPKASTTYVTPSPRSTTSAGDGRDSGGDDDGGDDNNSGDGGGGGDEDRVTTSSLSSCSSSSSSVDNTPIDASAQRHAWQQREQSKESLHHQHHHHHHQRHRHSRASSVSGTTTPTPPSTSRMSSVSVSAATAVPPLHSLDAETLQRLVAFAQQQQKQQQQQQPHHDTTVAYASPPPLGSLHHHHHQQQHQHQHQPLADASDASRSQKQQQQQRHRQSRFSSAWSALVFALVAVLAAGGYALYAYMHTPALPPVSTVAWRMAQVLESDFCIPVSAEEVRAGRTHDGVDLKALRQTMFVHLNAGGLRGICAQHLEAAAPVCQCLLRMSDPAVDGKLSQAKESDLLDMYNLNIEHVSEKAVPVRERHVFCGNGENRYWIMRHRTCLARYMGNDGEYHRGHFNGSQSAVVQSMWELHMGYSFCLIDGNMVMLKKLRDNHLYGKGIDQQWNDRRRLAAHADGGQARVAGLLAPDHTPIYRGISPTDTWTNANNMRPVAYSQQQQQQQQ